MFALITISLVLFAGIFLAMRFWRKGLDSSSEPNRFPVTQPKFASLFSPTDEEVRILSNAENEKRKTEMRENFRKNLVEKLKTNDLMILLKARDFGDSEIYNGLLEIASENLNVVELADFVSTNNLPANEKLVGKCFRRFGGDISSSDLTKILHISALTNSAEIFLQTVEKIVTLWKEKRLNVTSVELVAAFESHFWLLANEARTSGAGFLLKERLADVRREVLGK